MTKDPNSVGMRGGGDAEGVCCGLYVALGSS